MNPFVSYKFMVSLILVLLLIVIIDVDLSSSKDISVRVHRYSDDHDGNYHGHYNHHHHHGHKNKYPAPTKAPVDELPKYDANNLLEFLKPVKDRPLDLIYIIDKYYDTAEEESNFKTLFVKILGLTTEYNGYGDDANSGISTGLIVNSEEPELFWALPDSRSYSMVLALPRPQFVKSSDGKIDMAKALDLASKEFCRNGRPNSKKMVYIFTATASASDPKKSSDELSLIADIFITPVGKDISPVHVLNAVGNKGSNVFSFESYLEGSSKIEYQLEIPAESETPPRKKCGHHSHGSHGHHDGGSHYHNDDHFEHCSHFSSHGNCIK